MKSFVVLLPVLLAFAHAQTANFARNLQICVDNPSKTLDTCLRETLEELRSVMPYGIEELNLAKTEPLVLKKLKFRDNRPLIKLDATFSDVSGCILGRTWALLFHCFCQNIILLESHYCSNLFKLFFRFESLKLYELNICL